MIKLRAASNKDRRLIWEWSNDPDVRAESFSSEAIPFNDHVKWFESKIGNPDCFLYIAEDSSQTPIGQVRFELEDNDATISISLDRKFRHKGYGSMIIALASQNIFAVSKASVIHAYIKERNFASASAFKKAGYVFQENKVIKGQKATHLILTKKAR